MFSGIIHHQGKVESNKVWRENKELKISVPKIKARLGDSIAINGICLTVVKKNGSTFTFHAMPQTLQNTTLSKLKKGDVVNLEPALKMGDELGGHIVLGHMDTVTTVKDVKNDKNGVRIKFNLAKEFSKLIIKRGSVAIDGISLSVADCGQNWFEVALIPFTLKNTTLGKLKKGDEVNVEFDMLGKYALKAFSKK